MSLYLDKFVRVVKKEMDRYGFDLEIIRDTSTFEYDPVNPLALQQRRYILVGVILFDLTLQSNGDTFKPNSLINAGDKQLFIQPPEDDGFYNTNETDVVLPNRDKIKIGNKLYKIITFKQLNPSATDSVLFECYIRQ